VIGRVEGEAVPGEPPADGSAPAPRDPGWRPQPGDWVWIVPLGQAGRVAGEAGDDAWSVDVGRMRIRAAGRDLRPADALPGVEESARAGPAAGRPEDPTMALRLEKTGEVAPEISLRGMRVDEALPRLDKYLDDAVLAGLREVRV